MLNLCMGRSARKRISVTINQETRLLCWGFPVFLGPYFPRRTVSFRGLFITKSLFSFIILASSEGTGETLSPSRDQSPVGNSSLEVHQRIHSSSGSTNLTRAVGTQPSLADRRPPAGFWAAASACTPTGTPPPEQSNP